MRDEKIENVTKGTHRFNAATTTTTFVLCKHYAPKSIMGPSFAPKRLTNFICVLPCLSPIQIDSE